MSPDNENESIATNITMHAISTEKQTKVMKKGRNIKEPDERRLYRINHQDIINTIPTKYLNSYSTIKGHKFIRRNSFVSFSVFNQGSADVIKTIREDITRLTDDFKTLKDRYEQLKEMIEEIINTLAEHKVIINI